MNGRNLKKARNIALLLACGILGLGAASPIVHSAPPCWAHHEVCSTTTTSSTTTAAATTYLFDDEFSGAASAPPGASEWWATPWCATSSNDSFGCYNAANAFLNGQGQLVLRVSNGTMGRTYDFARIQTFQEGSYPLANVLWSQSPPIRVEARIKFAPGAGIWGALWPMGVGSTPLELDVQEFRGAVPSEDTCHVHGPVEGNATIDTGQDLSAGWHVYWLDYTAATATFGVDSLTCGSFTTPAQAIGIRLDNTVGPVGSWGGLGGPPPASDLPADMLVDYVRVTSLP